ncbi:hypothetical protein BS329_07275 [Amycolatopsis coloradensis]|uniref:Uncharacterized protein n=1 Tax=Amycolatopsis coloradensis TaxID=76021 RepID=A0A1R0KY36_9PSEU|nr:hypothetical protein BS329_07275 [Amycolatopsis coloradensis]
MLYNRYETTGPGGLDFRRTVASLGPSRSPSRTARPLRSTGRVSRRPAVIRWSRGAERRR